MTDSVNRRRFVVGSMLSAGAVGVGTLSDPTPAKADLLERVVCATRDFGARGDGVASDSQAIQSALDWVAIDPPPPTAWGATPARPGGVVNIAAGVYRLTFPLRIHGNTRLQLANGAELRRDFNSAVYWPPAAGPDTDKHAVMLVADEGASHISVAGGTWNANGSNYPTKCDLFYGRGLSHLRFEGVTFVDPHHHAIDIAAFSDVRITDCRFLGRIGTDTREAIQLDPNTIGGAGGSDNHQLTVDRCYFGPNPDGQADSVPWPCGVGNHYQAAGTFCFGIKVTACVFDGMTDKAIHALSFVDSEITGNRFLDCTGHGIYAKDCDKLAVSDNVAAGLGKTFANLYRSRRCRVTGNTATDVGQNGLWAKESSRLSVSGNLFDGLGYRGVHVQRCDHVNLSGNSTIDADSDGAGRPAIQVDSGSSRTTIVGNTADGVGIDIVVSGSTTVTVTGNVHIP